MPFDDEGRSYDRRIGTVLLLPGAITQHGNRWRGRLIVRRGNGAAGEGADTESSKIVAGDEFAAQGFGHVVPLAAAHTELRSGCLEGGQLLEFGGSRPETKK